MTHPSRTYPDGRQTGIALMILMVALLLAVSFLLVNVTDPGASRRRAMEASRQTLLLARDALITYAYRFEEIQPGQPPGYLPCPDTDGDGLPDPPCALTGESAIGFLPWKALGIPQPRDSSGGCLWYAVSGQYKNNRKSVLSSDSDGHFLIQDSSGSIVQGQSSKDRAVAVLFAPHRATGSQNRSHTAGQETTCGSNQASDPINQPENYLDRYGTIDNARGQDLSAGAGQPGNQPLPTALPSVFTTGPANDSGFNDQLMWIGPEQLQPVRHKMDQWVLGAVTRCLQAYADGNGDKLPWVAPLNPAAPPAYSGTVGERFGRLADVPDTTGDPSMDTIWPVDPVGGFRCFEVIGTQDDYSWWWWQDAWKEQVFAGIDQEYAPTGSAAGAPAMTLDKNGSTSSTRAVILVGGRAGSGQTRVTSADKGDIANYLEAENIPGSGPGTIPPGDEHFQVVNGADQDQGDSL